MRRRHAWAGGFILGIALMLLAVPALGVITELTHLGNILKDARFIFTVKVEALDAEKLTLVLTVDEALKGKKPPFVKMPINLKGDAEATKNKDTPQLLKRLAVKLPLIVFVMQRDEEYVAFGYTNGTWFQMTAAKPDGDTVPVWAFTHCEPFLRRTFKGTTTEMRQVIVDALAGKKKPPSADVKEKPGLGPELKAEDRPKERSTRHAPHLVLGGGPLLAVIPSVFIVGPLGVLAALFPAVFGGLILVLKRWMVALTVLSINSTLILLQAWFHAWLFDLGSFWASPLTLWLTISLVTFLGMLWAWRRHLDRVAGAVRSIPRPAVEVREEPPASPSTAVQTATTGIVAAPSTPRAPARSLPRYETPGRMEVIVLAVCSLICLLLALWLVRPSTLDSDMWGKALLVLGCGVWLATLHALLVFWRSAGLRSRPALPGEGVMLWGMTLACTGLAATFTMESARASDGPGYRVLWRFHPDEPSWIASSPLVDGDRVYVGVVHGSAQKFGVVYCVDARNGKERWRFTNSLPKTNVRMRDAFSSPVLADGRLFFGEGFHQHADCRLFCVDPKTGLKKWDYQTSSHTESTPFVDEGRVYFGAGDHGLHCADIKTGKTVWAKPYQGGSGLHVDANPIVVNGRVYCGAGVGDVYKQTCFFCVNSDTGKEIWNIPTELPVWGMAVVEGKYVYVPLGNGNYLETDPKPAGAVLCLEAATGKRIWQYDTRDGVLTRVVADRDHVYFGSRDGHCYCVSREDGSLVWKHDMGSPVVASPALVEGGTGSTLYAISSAGLVCALKTDETLKEGESRVEWTFDAAKDGGVAAWMFSSPTIVENGDRRRIYFGSGFGPNYGGGDKGYLYCLEETFDRTPKEEK
jgi:outer membrane protein assembly factor BamB